MDPLRGNQPPPLPFALKHQLQIVIVFLKLKDTVCPLLGPICPSPMIATLNRSVALLTYYEIATPYSPHSGRKKVFSVVFKSKF